MSATRMATLLAPLGVAVLVYAGLCLLLYLTQSSLIYLAPRQAAAPGVLRTIDAGGTALRAAVQPADGAAALLYFGGNAEDVSLSLPEWADLYPGHALYLQVYRGYTGHAGTPSEAALQQDALALFDHVAAAHAAVHATVTVVGRSLGAALALHVAARRPVARLVLITPFDSLVELGAHHYPVFPVRWLLRDRHEAWRDAPAVRAPTLVVAADRDEVVPRARTEALLAHFARGIARQVVVPHSGHNTLSDRPEFRAALRGAP